MTAIQLEPDIAALYLTDIVVNEALALLFLMRSMQSN